MPCKKVLNGHTESGVLKSFTLFDLKQVCKDGKNIVVMFEKQYQPD